MLQKFNTVSGIYVNKFMYAHTQALSEERIDSSILVKYLITSVSIHKPTYGNIQCNLVF